MDSIIVKDDCVKKYSKLYLKDDEVIIPKKEPAEIWLSDINRLYPTYSKEDRDYFWSLCRKFQLDPVKREVHMLPGRGGGAPSIVIGYQVYIARACETGLLGGWEVTLSKDGEGDQKISCTVTITRKDFFAPFKWTAYLKEVSNNTPIWQKMPSFMLRKVTIAQAFRLCFPEHLGGLPYGEEEMG